jgi:D-arabinose 1-dehydrogenase-like Zn-dependent alcohol dehydrogenase
VYYFDKLLGICHTDIHMIDNDWGMSRYPLVPGHEIVGRVIGVGSAITNIKEGESVCLGVVCQTCMTCSYCKCGNDNLCLKREFTYFGNPTDETGSHPHHGGFGSYMRTDGRKLLKVPDGLEERYVGPLMCAGITVWEPLVNYLQGTDGKGKTIGVVGIGGLGHLAVKFAHKMGANVVAFSRGSRKDQLAKDLGASSFVDTTSDDAMKAAEETKFDQLIITIAGGKIDLDKWFPLMNREGNM